MSTRWYPIYQRGNPQLRVFLPNFWLKLIRPFRNQQPNIVHFECSMEMTKHDVRNYLEKIYNVPVVDVRTRITMGKFRREPLKKYVIKDDDIKYAFVVLPKETKFEFPNIFEKKSGDLDDQEKELSKIKEDYQRKIRKNEGRKNIPSWFSI